MVDQVRRAGGGFEAIQGRGHVKFEPKSPHKDEYRVNSVYDQTLRGIKENKGVASPDHRALYADPASVAEAYQDQIEEHIDRRVQLFFMQLVSCYRTPYHFEWAEANDEYGSGANHQIKINARGRGKVFKTEAAHSSTLPCLIAYPRRAWEKYQAQEEEKPKGFVYLKYGHGYLQQNSTMELARFVNRADCLVDGTHTNSKLRNEVIEIVNEVAKGRCDPKKGLDKFLVQLENFVVQARDRLTEADPRYFALNLYAERIEEVKEAIEEDPGYFDQLLSVKVDQHPKEAVLRKVVYQRRFRLIQKCETIESEIARTVLDAQNAMLGKNRKELKNLDYRLRYALLKGGKGLFKKRVEKLFCTSLDQLQAGIERNEERLRSFEGRARIGKFREKHALAIENLQRDLRAHFRDLSKEEFTYRAELFKGLRCELNGWTQSKFAEKFQADHPGESMRQPIVSCMEQLARLPTGKAYVTSISQRQKNIDRWKAAKIAQTFGVDRGLFLPAIVSSAY